MRDKPNVTRERLLHGGSFVLLKELEWRDAYGAARRWESAERPDWRGAVLLIANLRPSGRVVLIRQFRPPARRQVYEFPAGLIDAGEEPLAAAARELREETGYEAASLRLCPAAYTTPGLSSESVYMVLADIDELAAANLRPRPQFDETEMIETFLIERTDLPGFYRRESAAGACFDAKLAAYILALDCAPGRE